MGSSLLQSDLDHSVSVLSRLAAAAGATAAGDSSRSPSPSSGGADAADEGGRPGFTDVDDVVGKKYIRLYPSKISEELYPFQESMLSNSSKVDLDKPDFAEYPKAQHLDFTDCILEEGEMLYIPPKWWHYVISLSTSFSVSFWWSENNPTDSESDQ